MTSPSWATNTLDLATFQSPPIESRILPFWFWNGAMDEATVRRQVRQMADGGCGGFFIHPRQGLALPYLSSEWFARVKLAVEEAARLGLQVWLYDEYPYPSGIAGGLLTANRPDLRARTLHYQAFQAEGGQPLRHEFPLGRVICARAYHIEEGQTQWEHGVDISTHLGVVLTGEQLWRWPMAHIPYNEKRFMADEGRLVLTWTPSDGIWQICVGIEREQRGFKYYDCFFDPLHSDAAPEFLRLTHERYAQTVGDYFGTTIPGIFTDETEPPLWSPHLEAALRDEGLDLGELLPALHHDDHPHAAKLRASLRRCALQLFAERWEEPIARWCADHNLIWSAEKPIWRPSQYGAVAQPATDAGHRRADLPPEPLTADLRANHRAAMASAEHNGTSEVRCECFHSLGWGATLQDQKWAIDWLCAQGVSRFTPHAFYATSSGLAKHDAAPSFFAENPYWPHFKQFSDYAARLSYAMSRGRERARIALLHPTVALWSSGPQVARVRAEYEGLMNALLAEHHQFHVVDALDLLRATSNDGALLLGHARYETLIVPPLYVTDEETRGAMEAAVSTGLLVLAGEWPGVAADDETRPPCVTFADRAVLMEYLRGQNPLSLTDEQGGELPQVWALWREADEQQLLFLANTGGEAVTARVNVAAQPAIGERWSLETGTVERCESRPLAGVSQFSLALPPFGSCLVVGQGSSISSASPVTPQPRSTLVLPVEDEWQLTLDQPNALRLNTWRVSSQADDCSAANYKDEAWSLRPALPLRYLDQVEKRWIEACSRHEGVPVWYRRHVACDTVPPDLALLIENGAIWGDWQLWINGVLVPRNAFAPTEYNGSDKVAAPLAAFFQSGENVLALRVDNAPLMGGLRTPLHLLGSFALRHAEGAAMPRVLTTLPSTSLFNDLLAAGLPHFSGMARYSRTLPEGTLVGIDALELPQGFSDVAELTLNGQCSDARAWSPYQWPITPTSQPSQIEVAITNTLLPFMEGQVWDTTIHQGRNV